MDIATLLALQQTLPKEVQHNLITSWTGTTYKEDMLFGLI
jgi:hypothetical protein